MDDDDRSRWIVSQRMSSSFSDGRRFEDFIDGHPFPVRVQALVSITY